MYPSHAKEIWKLTDFLLIFFHSNEVLENITSFKGNFKGTLMIMVKNGEEVCDTFTIPSFRPDTMYIQFWGYHIIVITDSNYIIVITRNNISSFHKKKLDPKVILFSYNWPVCDVAIFEVTLVRLPLWHSISHETLEQPASFFACV